MSDASIKNDESKEETSGDRANVMVRMPTHLYRQIKELARAGYRTLNGQILMILEGHLSRANEQADKHAGSEGK